MSPELKSKVVSNDYDKSGRHSGYTKITDATGFKYGLRYHDDDENHNDDDENHNDYGYERGMMNLYALHEVLYDIGYGPKVWGFQKIDEGSRRHFGFFIEHCEKYDYQGLPLKNEIIELVDAVYGMGMELCDYCKFNFGMLKDKLVIIDSGCISYEGDVAFNTEDNIAAMLIQGDDFDKYAWNDQRNRRRSDIIEGLLE
jgi:hypothetical protein